MRESEYPPSPSFSLSVGCITIKTALPLLEFHWELSHCTFSLYATEGNPYTSAFFKPAHLKYVGTMLLIPAIALDRRNIFGKQYICFWLWSSCGCNPLLRPCSQRLPPNTRHHYPAVLAEMQIAKSQQIFPQMCTNLFLNVHRGVPIHLTRAKLQLFKEKSLRLFCQTSHRTFEFTKDFTILPKPISFACLLI